MLLLMKTKQMEFVDEFARWQTSELAHRYFFNQLHPVRPLAGSTGSSHSAAELINFLERLHEH